ncbi:hypothetical protein PENTCL1PPCAC_13739 [Pristionchus entomophagus]|uniref:MRH domain-containing protein n=1 Tax=Pristionchus entomophagus TaxID=358040 RepID=A0AAV5T8C3_9BILA|nr:hypothetical protein PENTCL1PPCAC_13739 [Pristionchus entomophagus]
MTRMFDRFSLLFLLLRLLLVSGSLDFYELNNAQYEFNIDAKPRVFDEIPDDNDTLITVSNKHGQKFVCTLPERPKPTEKDLSSGSSVNPQIAADQITKNLVKCIKLKSGWWTYTLCPRKSVTQSHGKEGDADFVSNSLGIFTGKYAMPTVISASEGEKMLHLEEKYDLGAVCDITGKPRTTVVHYTCEPLYSAKDAMIYALDEEASCEYKVEVRTGALCSIPQFQPSKPPQTQPVQCAPVLSSEAAARLEKGDEIKKKNKEKAKRELAAIKAEYEETKVRRWSIERRRIEFNHEGFDLKMRDLDEEYIELTRDQLEWNIIAKTGEEPTPETKETIHELLDNMEAIETAQVYYDSVADEDRANIWYYFHNPKWRSDGFPLLLNEVDLRNGFATHINELIANKGVSKKQKERLKRLLEFGHPSRLEAILSYAGPEHIKIRLAQQLRASVTRSIQAVTPLTDSSLLTMKIDELERRIRESNRHSTERPSLNTLLDIFTAVWAIAKIDELNPMRNDDEWYGRTGMETITVAETIDRLQRAWEFYELQELAEKEENDIRLKVPGVEQKYAKNRAGIDRVRRTGGEFMRYYELAERERDPSERSKTLQDLVQMVERGGKGTIDFMMEFIYESVRNSLIDTARERLPQPSSASRLINDLGQDTAVAVFRDNIDARAVMEQLEQAGLGSETVKLQIHLKDGQVLSVEDDKIIKELIERELKEARIREKTKQRQRAYEYVFKGDEHHLV